MEGLGWASGALVQLHGIVKDGGKRGRLAACEMPAYFFHRLAKLYCWSLLWRRCRLTNWTDLA